MVGVKLDGKWGVVDKSCNYVLPCEYDNIKHNGAVGIIEVFLREQDAKQVKHYYDQDGVLLE
jgi:hypothetical protein